MGKTVAVLFTRADSIYKTLEGVDVWDAQRDALRWPGGSPVVAHPPCRAWGQLSHMAKPRENEKELGLWAVDRVRQYGGVLEHPKQSKLWAAKKLPLPNETDEFGGWTLPIFQCNFGHTAEKPTYLYIVGLAPESMPPMPIFPGKEACIIGSHGRRSDGSRLQPGEYGYRKSCFRPDREHTPPKLAEWLVNVARECEVRND